VARESLRETVQAHLGSPGPAARSDSFRSAIPESRAADGPALVIGRDHYQVNVVSPDGVAPGDAVPIIITVADRPGPPVTLAVAEPRALASGASVGRTR
jgi:hypothetical protein